MSRVTSVGAGPVRVSRTHQTSSSSGWMNRSANRMPALISGTGLTGRGSLPGASGSSRYSR